MITIFIDELFYDNISIQGISLKGNAEYRKQLKVLTECESYLNENLKGKHLKAFKQFGEAWNEVNDETNKKFFEEGFINGARCILDLFVDINKD